jgi:hypothetical protein
MLAYTNGRAMLNCVAARAMRAQVRRSVASKHVVFSWGSTLELVYIGSMGVIIREEHAVVNGVRQDFIDLRAAFIQQDLAAVERAMSPEGSSQCLES